jgi:superfamily I DNA/RNA helicase
MLELLESELESLQPDQVAFVTFTRAARFEARGRAADKLGLSDEELVWFRTLHSTAWSLLGMTTAKLFRVKHWHEFCRKHHYSLTPEKERDRDGDELWKPPQKTPDDELRSVYEWGRHRLMSPREAWRAVRPKASERAVAEYSERYEAFKEDRDLLDYTDLLEKGRELQGPPVTVTFVDEAQDLTPLQVAAARRWFGGCERVYIAGDDDQAIYIWSGASPEWLKSLHTAATHHEILGQSYRVPSVVQQVANRIIARNRVRVEKPYRAMREGGSVRCLSTGRALELVLERYRANPEHEVFVLLRNRIHAKRWVTGLQLVGVPYLSEIGSPGPLGKSALIRAVLAARKLQKAGEVTGKELSRILDYVPTGELCPHGVKARAKRYEGTIQRMTLVLDWGLSSFLKRLEVRGPALALFKERLEVLEYLDLLLRELGEIPREPKVRVMTIHGSKGREADTVVICPDVTRATYRELVREEEGENRVAYVAVTRTRDELVIADPETTRFYPYWDYV